MIYRALFCNGGWIRIRAIKIVRGNGIVSPLGWLYKTIVITHSTGYNAARIKTKEA